MSPITEPLPIIFVSPGMNSCYPLAAPDEPTQPLKQADTRQKPCGGPEQGYAERPHHPRHLSASKRQNSSAQRIVLGLVQACSLPVLLRQDAEALRRARPGAEVQESSHAR